MDDVTTGVFDIRAPRRPKMSNAAQLQLSALDALTEFRGEQDALHVQRPKKKRKARARTSAGLKRFRVSRRNKTPLPEVVATPNFGDREVEAHHEQVKRRAPSQVDWSQPQRRARPRGGAVIGRQNRVVVE